jgi:hypothetical protein
MPHNKTGELLVRALRQEQDVAVRQEIQHALNKSAYSS